MTALTKEYSTLFNGITETITELEWMVEKLKFLQQQAEEEYIKYEDQNQISSSKMA